MKTALISLAVGALLTAVVVGQTTASRPSLSIAYVNAQRVFAETTEGKAQLARVQVLQQQRANELRARQQTLEGLRKQMAEATENAARVRLQQQESQQRSDLERTTLQAQQEVQNLQRQVATEFQNRLRGVLDELVKGQGLQVVLNGEQAVLWSAPGSDLTNAVIERFNSQTAAAPAKP
jgi:Skp family chaperone for outer membrane proteins